MQLVDCKERTLAMVWTFNHLGLPEGFKDFKEWADYTDELMDEAEYSEHWLLDDRGYKVAYFAWCYSNDIHHKGCIFDVTNVVVKPNADFKVYSGLTRKIHAMAKAMGCEWVSRCVHEDDGSIRNLFKRV